MCDSRCHNIAWQVLQPPDNDEVGKSELLAMVRWVEHCVISSFGRYNYHIEQVFTTFASAQLLALN